MKNTVKWLVIAAILIAIISGSLFLYDKFSSEYDGNNLIQYSDDGTSNNKEPNVENPTNSQSNVDTAPDFTVTDYNGNKVNLSDFKGKPVVLNFWATWCYYCKVEMPDFNTAYEKYPEVQFLMVNSTDGYRETVDTAKSYIEKEEFGFDVFFDTERQAVRAYNVTGYPTTVFIDKDGNIVAQGSGMLDLETLEENIVKITE